MSIGAAIGKGIRSSLKKAAPIFEAAASPRDVDLDYLMEGVKDGAKGLVKQAFDLSYRAVGESKSYLLDMAKLRGDDTLLPTFVKLMDGITDETAKIAAPKLQALQQLKLAFPEDDGGAVADFLEARLLYPTDPRVASTGRRLKSIFHEFHQMASEAGLMVHDRRQELKWMSHYLKQGKDLRSAQALTRRRLATKAFEPLPNYFPHYFDELTIWRYKKSGKLRDDALKEIMEKFEVGKSEASMYLDAQLAMPTEFRGGVLQHSRIMDLRGYSKDWYRVAQRYIWLSSKRLAEAKLLGGRDEVIRRNLVPKIMREYQDSPQIERSVKTLFKATVGQQDRRYAKLIKPLTGFHTITMLSTAGLMQPTQLLNLIRVSGTKTTFEAVGDAIRGIKWGRGWWHGLEIDPESKAALAEQSGVLMHSILDDLGPLGMGQLPAFYSRIIGLEFMDNFNRIVAGLAGRASAQVWANDLIRGSSAAKRIAAGRLEKAGLDVDAIVRRGGILEADELRQAGRWLARYTQFGNRPIDMPELRAHPLGPLFYLFRSYSLQQAAFLHHETVNAIQLRDFGRVSEWLAATAVTAPMVTELIDFVRQNPPKTREDDTALEAHIRQTLMAGTAGAFWDVSKAAQYGPQALALWSLGPTATEFFTVVASDLPSLGGAEPGSKGAAEIFPSLPEDSEEAFKRARPMLEHLTRRIPIFGPTLYNVWWGKHYGDTGK